MKEERKPFGTRMPRRIRREFELVMSSARVKDQRITVVVG